MTGKSPSLEAISNPSLNKAQISAALSAERRRRPRIALSAEQFRLASNGKVFSVADLSTGGMALRVIDPMDFHLFPVASVFEGVLRFRDERYTLRAKVCHVGRELIGCEFDGLSEAAKAALQKYLDPEVLGKEIRPIPASDAASLWYHGPSGTDLLLTRGVDGQYRRIMLFVLGSFIQWDSEAGVSTGRARESMEQTESWGIVRFETMLLDRDETPDSNKLSIAKALILSSNLPQDLKKWCVRQLE